MRARRPTPTSPGSFESLAIALEVGCPSCGAALRIDEDTTAVRCEHCGRDFLLTADGQARRSYIVPRVATDEAQLTARGWLRAEGHRATRIGQGRWVLAPYWRYRTKAFKWFEAQRRSSSRGAPAGGEADDRDSYRDLAVRSLDFTMSASSFDSGLPFIGTREDPLTARIPGRQVESWAELLPVTVMIDEARAAARQRADRSTEPTAVTVRYEKLTLLDERLEIVYFPFFVLDYQFRESVRRVVVDGWSGAVTAHFDEVETTGDHGDVDEAPVDAGTARQIGDTAFLPARCPVCLTEFVPAQLDRVHVCPSCHRAWEIAGPVAREVRQMVARNGVATGDVPEETNGDEQEEAAADSTGRLLPFWAIRAVANGWHLSADTAEDEEGDHEGHHLVVYVPAFEGRHIERMCQLGIHLTRAHPAYETDDGWSDRYRGCAIGRADAARMAWVMLGAMASPDAQAFRRFIERGEVGIEDAQLTWIPFRASGLYLREPVTGALVREASTRPWEIRDELAA